MEAVDAGSFNRRYLANSDPWGYRTSSYEKAKYEQTIAALPSGTISDGLEIGCSNGSFTALLARHCERLVAIDFSVEAVRLARARTAGLRNVLVAEGDGRHELPDGSFDLIVCSEVLYYWTRSEVEAFVPRSASALRPGGSLLAVHWRGDDPDAPLDGDSVHSLLEAGLSGLLVHDAVGGTSDYRLDRWSAPGTGPSR